ncbi:MAG: MgtC/SapB family protein [Nanoarchaeales archaeon]|nr:MgtC/SapB family protein [Nanoarchaeales archaeon]
MFDEFLVGLFFAIILGAFVGAQREMKLQQNHRMDFAGFRTFTFISLLGYIIGFLSFNIIEDSSLIVFSVIGFFILTSISYYSLSIKYKNYVSETSQIVAILTFLIGILISLGKEYYYIAVVLTIVIASFLVLGTQLHTFAKNISIKEVYATMKFALISVIILPVLPNKNFGPLDFETSKNFFLNFFTESTLVQFTIFNPYQIWFLVVIISAITYVGYILIKILGTNRGLLLTGVLGGLMSSTATATSFSIDSKRLKNLSNPLAIGIVLACSIMFFRIILEVIIVNPSLVTSVLFVSLMGFVGIIISVYLIFKNKTKHVGKLEGQSPFTLKPSITFGLLFIAIIFLTQVLRIKFGDSGIYFIALISGFLDVDAITLTLSKMALENSISNFTASSGIFIAALSNTIFKGGIAYYLGSKHLSKIVMWSFFIIVFVGLFSLFLV